MNKIKIAFFDAKDYDKNSFIRANEGGRFDISFYETRLTKDTCRLAEGCDAVCVFVNDDVNREVIDAFSTIVPEEEAYTKGRNICAKLKEKIDAGKTGINAGEGFYKYN